MDALQSKTWDMISSATAGVLKMNNKRLSVDLNSSLKTKRTDNKQCSSVVEYSPEEGQNVINLVNSKFYAPQISIESGDFITIVYKKRVVSGNTRNSFADANETIATFANNDSCEAVFDSEKKEWNHSNLMASTEMDYETSDDLYLTAIEIETNDIESDAEIAQELMETTSNSAVCGCNENSHSRTKCLNTVKYDICLDDDADFNEFCQELNPDKGSGSQGSSISKNEARIRPKEKLETSNSRRNKRLLNISNKKESLSLNDSFPETIFPPRKKRFTMTSTPARNHKKDLISKLTLDSAKTLENPNSGPYAVEE